MTRGDEGKPKRAQIVLGRVPIQGAGEGVMLALRHEATVELYAGELWPGVNLTVAEARVLAYKILHLAAEIESGAPPEDRFYGLGPG